MPRHRFGGGAPSADAMAIVCHRVGRSHGLVVDGQACTILFQAMKHVHVGKDGIQTHHLGTCKEELEREPCHGQCTCMEEEVVEPNTQGRGVSGTAHTSLAATNRMLKKDARNPTRAKRVRERISKQKRENKGQDPTQTKDGKPMPFNTCNGVPKCSLCTDHRRLLLCNIVRSAIKVSLNI